MIQEGGTSYAQTFPDTAVALKPTQTPAHAKKMKPEGTLGCTPLLRTTATLGSVSAMVTDIISQVATQSARDYSDIQTQTWSEPPTVSHAHGNSGSIEKTTIQDINQNPVFAHVDQFGNPVKVQATVGPQTNTQELLIQTGEQQVTQNVGNITSLEALRSNPMIEQLVEEWIAISEIKIKGSCNKVYIPTKKKWKIQYF